MEATPPSQQGGLICSASVGRRSRTRQLKIVVTGQWHYQPEAVRQELATSLWTLWARMQEPDRPDSAPISIVSTSGKEVGGSRIWGGSLIWVE